MCHAVIAGYSVAVTDIPGQILLYNLLYRCWLESKGQLRYVQRTCTSLVEFNFLLTAAPYVTNTFLYRAAFQRQLAMWFE